MRTGFENNKLKWFSFVAPALILYLVFFIVPSASSIYYAFTDWDGVNSDWVGLANFVKAFKDPKITGAIGNTLFYTIGIVLLQNAMGLLLAVLLQRNCTRNNFIRTLVFMPYVFSPLVIGFIFKFIFEPNIGSMNAMLRSLGLEKLILKWLTDPKTARCMIVIITTWQCMGYTMLVNISGLKAISNDYLEAAQIDGANRWQTFWRVTFPMLAPSTTINIMLSLIGDIQLFDQIHALTGGGPYYQTDSIATAMYRVGFGSNGSQWGYGAAVSVVMFTGILVLTITVTTLLRKREGNIL